MAQAGSIELAMQEASQVGAARRLIVELGLTCGFDETARSNLSIVATELASNLVKHAHDGVLIVRIVHDAVNPGIEILSLDRGPGMSDIERCFVDGYSTSGTSGTGLGAVRRLSHEWDIFTLPKTGTAQVVRIGTPRAEGSPTTQVAGISIPAPGEVECGDAWCWLEDGGLQRLLVVDGLGHGPAAAIAAAEAVQTFQSLPQAPPLEMLKHLHVALRPTRGAAAAVFEIDATCRKVRLAGVGNIAAQIAAPAKRQNLVSLNGTVGVQMPNPREFTYDIPEGAILCCWSDGLTSRTSPENYGGLLNRDPAIVAGVLYRDFKRGRDDATIVVCRI